MKKIWTKRILAGTMATSILMSQSTSVFADVAPDGKTNAADLAGAMGKTDAWENWQKEWETLQTDWTQISLTPGSDISKVNFAWYAKKSEATTSEPKLIIGEGKEMKNPKTFTAVRTDATTDSNHTSEDTTDDTAYYSNKVTVDELKENTVYYYKYELTDGTYSEPQKYQIGLKENFSFIYVGDPQIGSSNEMKAKKPENLTDEFYQVQSESVRSDAFNWEQTLNQAYEKSGNQASFVLSAGDQIQTNATKVKNKEVSEIEYTGYLSPDILKSLPVATTVGNHDADNENYTYHFNTPNNSTLGSNGVVGGDYWFSYGSALFIMLNTQDTNVQEHKEFIEQAVEANKDCKWRIVTLHQDIYGSAEHSNEPEITNLRYQLVPFFEENNIDVVLTGHDHAYSRSKILKGGKSTVTYTDDEFDEQLEKDLDVGDSTETLYTAPGNIKADTTDESEKAYLNYLNAVMDAEAVQTIKEENGAVINPTGILYMTANSSSGSKYYDLVPRMQTYIANRWQEDVPTYSVVDITDSTFTINTYRTDTGEKIDDTLTLAKVTIDKSGLESLVAQAKQTIVPNQAEYTEDSYKAFAQALAGAEQVLNDVNAINSEVQAAITALTNAQGLLKKQIENTPVSQTYSILKDCVKKISNQAYTGKSIKPAVSVTVNGNALTEGTDYTVTYSNNKKIGAAKAVVTGIGQYTGTVTISFKIVPKAISLKSVKSKTTKAAVVKFTAGKGSLSGYQVVYSTSSSFKNSKKITTKKTTATLKSLKSGKKYYVKVRGYKKVSGKIYYGAYSKTMKVKVK